MLWRLSIAWSQRLPKRLLLDIKSEKQVGVAMEPSSGEEEAMKRRGDVLKQWIVQLDGLESLMMQTSFYRFLQIQPYHLEHFGGIQGARIRIL